MEDPLLYTTITLIILLLAFKLFFRTKKRHYKNLPPSPPSFPIIGHLQYLLKRTPIHQTFQTISSKYGAVFSLWLGSRRVVVVSSPSAVAECFSKNDVVLADRPRFIVGKHVSYNYTTIVTSPFGDHWRNLRRIATTEIFSSIRLSLTLGIRSHEVKRLLRKISRNNLHRQGFERVELKSMFTELTFNIMMRIVAGKRYYGDDVTDEEEAWQFREILTSIFENGGAGNPGDFLPILNWIPGGYEKRVKRLAKRADLFLQRLLEEHRSSKKNHVHDGSQNTMIDHLLSLQESQPDYYTEQIIKGLILILLLAGTDTAALTLEWAMSNLLNHPHVLKKVRAELDSQIGQQRLVDESDLSKLPYLQCIISETLRLYPASPLLVPHYSSKDCTIGGYDLPCGTILLVNAWAMHRDPELWEDADSFKPERFVNSNEIEGYKLIPFGVGRRACPGIGLAQRMVGLTLGSLIQCFEWERVSEEKVDMTEAKGLTMPKTMPLEAMCKLRSIMNVVLLESIDDI